MPWSTRQVTRPFGTGSTAMAYPRPRSTSHGPRVRCSCFVGLTWETHPTPSTCGTRCATERFRPRRDGKLRESSAKGWWNAKAGLFAHAVAAALDGESTADAIDRFNKGGWNHKVVNRYAYIQIKKVGGAGAAKPSEICGHAADYADTLALQLALYRPHLVLGCGVGRDSPAGLLAAHVLSGGRKDITSKTGATWWEFSETSRPRAMAQLWHPARRGSRSELYQDVWSSVREVANKIGLVRLRLKSG